MSPRLAPLLMALSVCLLGTQDRVVAATASTPQWEFAGWYGGGAYPNLVFDPKIPGRVYVVSDVVGLWRSDDLGEQWTFMTEGLRCLYVAAIAIAPSDSNIVYAATQRGLYRSINAGALWQLAGTVEDQLYFEKPAARSVAIDPRNPQAVLIGTASGRVLFSDDGGVQWRLLGGTAQPLGAGLIQAVALDLTQGVAYVASKNGVARYDVAAQQWSVSPTTPKPVTDLVVSTRSPNTVYAAGASQLMISTDAGTTWTPSAAVPRGTTSKVELVEQGATPLVGVATSEGGYAGSMLWSQDGGKTWTNRAQKMIPDVVGNPTRVWMSAASRITSLRVDPFNPLHVFRTDYWGIWRSDDGGVTWREKIRGAPNTCGSDLTFSPSGNLFVATMDDGLLMSADGGRTYKAIAPTSGPYNPHIPGHVWRVAVLDQAGQRILATSSPWADWLNQVLISQDGGKTFTPSHQGLPTPRPYTNTFWGQGYPRALAVDPSNPNRIYMGVDGDDRGGLFISDDGGQSWAAAANQPASKKVYNALAVDPNDSNRLFWATCGYPAGGIFVSTNQGATWTRTFQSCVFDLAVGNDGTVYAGGTVTSAALWVSRDRGNTWRELKRFPGSVADAITIDPRDPKRVAVSAYNWSPGAGGKIHLTTDGGVTWTDITASLPNGTGACAMAFHPVDGSLYILRAVGSVYRATFGQPSSLVLATIGPQQVAEGQPLNLTLSATGVPGKTLTFSATGLPAGAALTGASLSWTPSFTQAGSYPVTFTVSDGTSTDSKTVTITVSNTNRPPLVTAGADAQSTWPAPATLQGAVSDPDGTLLTVAWTQVSGPGTVTFANAAGLGTTASFSVAGNYVLRLTASDGTASVSDNVVMTVQPGVVPVVPVILESEAMLTKTTGTRTTSGWLIWTNGYLGQEVKFPGPAARPYTIKVIARGDVAAGVWPNMQVRIDQRAVASVSVTSSSWTTYTVTTEIAEGTHQLAVVFTNDFYQAGVGNRNLEVDTVQVAFANRPATVSAGPDQQVTLPTRVLLTGTASDPDGITPTVQWTLLSGPGTVAFTNAAALQTTASFSDAGSYILRLTASDGSDTVNDDVAVTVRPESLVMSSVKATATPNGGGRLEWVTTQPASSRVEYGLTTAYGSCCGWTHDTATTTHTVYLTGLRPETLYHYRVQSTTPAGQDAISADLTLRTPAPPNRPPVLAPIGALQIAEGQALTRTLSASDPESQPLTFTATGLPAGAALTGASLSWTPNFTQAGTYPVIFNVSDGALTDTETVTLTVSNTNRPPVLAPIRPQSASEGQPITLTFAATEPENQPVTFTVSPLPSGAVLTGATLTWTPSFTQAGRYPLTVTASDGTLTDREDITIMVEAVNRPPVLTLPGAQTIAEGQRWSIGLAATDPDADAVTYAINPIPSGAALSGATLQWTPSFAQAGRYTLTISASDGQATVSQPLSVTVTNINRPPTVSAGMDQASTLPAPVTLTGTASDPDGTIPTVAWTLVSGPGPVSFDRPSALTTTANFSAVGTYVLCLTASDGIDRGSDDMVVIAQPPVVILPTTIRLEAELMPTKTTGSAVTDGWGLWSNGMIEQSVTFESAGVYQVDVIAKGQAAAGLWPIMELRIDGRTVAMATVGTTSWGTSSLLADVPAGSHRVGVAFVNDYYSPPADRNLVVDRLVITKSAAAATPTVPTTLEVEAMPTKTGGGGITNGWELWSNGYVGQTVNFPAAKTYQFTVMARGTAVAGIGPMLELRIDGRPVGQVTVSSTDWTSVVLTADVSAGTHQVAIAFTNDAYQPPQDRNLFIDQIRIAAL